MQVGQTLVWTCLHVLKWAPEQGCELLRVTPKCASQEGSLDKASHPLCPSRQISSFASLWPAASNNLLQLLLLILCHSSAERRFFPCHHIAVFSGALSLSCALYSALTQQHEGNISQGKNPVVQNNTQTSTWEHPSRPGPAFPRENSGRVCWGSSCRRSSSSPFRGDRQKCPNTHRGHSCWQGLQELQLQSHAGKWGT